MRAKTLPSGSLKIKCDDVVCPLERKIFGQHLAKRYEVRLSVHRLHQAHEEVVLVTGANIG